MIKKCMLIVLAAGLLLSPGCSGMGWLGYTLFGGLKDEVKAEYRIPHDSKVAVVIYLTRDVAFDYPAVRITLGAKICDTLKHHLSAGDSIETLNPRTVARYQNDNANWDSIRRSELARNLGADYVLFISLTQYTLREPGHMSLYQARFTAEAKLFSAEDTTYEEPVWASRDNFYVVHPREGTYDSGKVGKIQEEAEHMLAKKIALRFVDHTAPYGSDDNPEETP